ncbi:MAG: hypothetical protein ACHP7J_00125 [Terriglobales bacterium]
MILTDAPARQEVEERMDTANVPGTGSFVPQTDPLSTFLSLSRPQQIEFVKSLSIDELTILHNLYAESIADRRLRQVEYAVYELMLLRLDPGEHDEVAQDSELRLALTPQELAKVRADTYENQVRPLLHAAEDAQRAFVDSLPHEERVALLKLLDRYAREYGRSKRCKELEELVHSFR